MSLTTTGSEFTNCAVCSTLLVTTMVCCPQCRAPWRVIEQSGPDGTPPPAPLRTVPRELRIPLAVSQDRRLNPSDVLALAYLRAAMPTAGAWHYRVGGYELAQALGLDRKTGHDILKRLRRLGYLEEERSMPTASPYCQARLHDAVYGVEGSHVPQPNEGAA